MSDPGRQQRDRPGGLSWLFGQLLDRPMRRTWQAVALIVLLTGITSAAIVLSTIFGDAGLSGISFPWLAAATGLVAVAGAGLRTAMKIVSRRRTAGRIHPEPMMHEGGRTVRGTRDMDIEIDVESSAAAFRPRRSSSRQAPDGRPLLGALIHYGYLLKDAGRTHSVAITEVPSSIYLSTSDPDEIEEFVRAFRALHKAHGIDIMWDGAAEHGSWFRKFTAFFRRAAKNPSVKQGGAVAEVAATTYLVSQPQAEANALNAAAIRDLVEAFETIKEVVVLDGSIFLVKNVGPNGEPRAICLTLSPLQMQALARNPAALRSAVEAFAFLDGFSAHAGSVDGGEDPQQLPTGNP